MEEKEWLDCTKPTPMMNFMRRKSSERKWRLFACGCCRLVWRKLPAICHRLVESLEGYADKTIQSSDLITIFNRYSPHQVAISSLPGGDQAALAVNVLGTEWKRTNVSELQRCYWIEFTARSVAESLAKEITWDEARCLEADLLRDIFGPQAFRSIAIEHDLLTWNNGTVRKLAQTIYAERCFQDMPILGDALEESGCSNQDILNHCRKPGFHARGCWVVDLLLGKQ